MCCAQSVALAVRVSLTKRRDADIHLYKMEELGNDLSCNGLGSFFVSIVAEKLPHGIQSI